METTCYYHGVDLDGITSGNIVLQKYPDAKMIPVNYGDTWLPEDVEGKRVIVVDFSFPDMAKIRDLCAELIWCDHHNTAKETQRRMWSSSDVKGYRDIGYAGCMLTYAYFNGIAHEDIYKAKIPGIVKCVSAYDMWEHDNGDAIDAFCATAFVELTSPDAPDFAHFFNIDEAEDLETHYIAVGGTLIKAAMNRVETAASSEKPKQIKSGNGAGSVSFLFVNATSDVSRLGAYINDELGIDIAAIYKIVGDECRISLRSKTCNVEAIARTFNGGGHWGAAGFSMKFCNHGDSILGVKQTLQSVIFTIYTMLEKKE